MENLDTVKSEQIIKEYLSKFQESKSIINVKDIIEQDFISQYLPKNINYKSTDDIQEKKNQFKNVIDSYSDYMCLLKQISNGKCPEFLAMLFSYDIIKNNNLDNKDKILENFINMFKLDIVPEFSEKIKYYSECYWEDITKSHEKYEDISDVLNKFLTKKFAYNIYSSLIKTKQINIYDKVRRLKRGSEMLKSKYGFVGYTDLYENLINVMEEYCKDKNLYDDNDEYEKIEKMINEFYNVIDFPQFFATIGDTPEQILLQSICESEKQNCESPDFIMKTFKLLNKCGDKVGKFRKNIFFSELIKNMQSSFSKLIETESDEKIKECIVSYNKLKYNGKLDFSLQYTVDKRRNYNEGFISENPIFKEMEKRMYDKIIEFSEKDFDKCMKLLEEIPECVIGNSNFIGDYTFKREVLPEIMGIKLSDEEKVILEGKKSFEEIMKFVKMKKRSKDKRKSTDDMCDYDDSENVLE